MVLPPPQPTSRILECLSICKCRRPQSVNPECEAFIIHKNGLPTHREGFRLPTRSDCGRIPEGHPTPWNDHPRSFLATEKKTPLCNFKKPCAPYSTGREGLALSSVVLRITLPLRTRPGDNSCAKAFEEI